MFQACVSISACIFYVFMNIKLYTGYVCINGHTAGLKKKLPTYLPYFSVARYANTIFFFCLRIVPSNVYTDKSVTSLWKSSHSFNDHDYWSYRYNNGTCAYQSYLHEIWYT